MTVGSACRWLVRQIAYWPIRYRWYHFAAKRVLYVLAELACPAQHPTGRCAMGCGYGGQAAVK